MPGITVKPLIHWYRDALIVNGCV